MAKGRITKSVSHTPPSLSAKAAGILLRRICERGQQHLASLPVTDSAESSWLASAQEALIRAFGSDSPHITRINNVGLYAFAFGSGSEIDWAKARERHLKERIEILEGLIDLLDTDVSLTDERGHSAIDASQDTSQNVFLVHGHDEHVLETVARFLQKLGLEVRILRELPNKGRTIIEKFVDYSEVGFAVILLTGDDRGGTKLDTYDEQRLRARQNVILELGFFLGRLGRDRVCAIYEEGVEIPSDYQGVVFVPYDNKGAWHIPLAKELKAAKIKIDLNNIL